MQKPSNSKIKEISSAEIQILFECPHCKRKASSEADKSTFKLCSGCYKVYYCNKECQLAHRKSHKVDCKAAKTNNLNSAICIPKDHEHSDLISFSQGDREGLQRMISRRVDLRALFSDEETTFSVLTALVFGRFYECTELLLQQNISPNAQNENGFTILIVACQEGLEEFVSLFLRYNADTNIRTIDGSSPLSTACNKGYNKCVSLLLQNNANPNITNNNGYSALHMACETGHDKWVSLLLQHNADPSIVNKDDDSSLHVASNNGHDKCVSLLLQHGVDPNTVDNDGFSALHLACTNGNDKCVSLLLQHGVDPNTAKDFGSSALYLACSNGHDKCVSLLLHAGGNTEQMSSSGFTPLLVACFRGHLKCVALLVEHGANIHVKSVPDLFSALHVSCMSGNFDLVAYILSLGLEVNTANKHGTTPLYFCQFHGLGKFAKLLIEHGAVEFTVSSEVLEDKATIEDAYVQNKESRQKAKHCDYPDCCNEGDDSQSLHACSSCHAVYYCSREHQEAHWKEHKKLCKAIKK